MKISRFVILSAAKICFSGWQFGINIRLATLAWSNNHTPQTGFTACLL